MGALGRPVGTARPPTRLSAPDDDMRDPALGAKVPRCAVCGVPATDSIVGPWSGNGRTYRIRVCGHCLGVDKQPNPDPLTADL